MIGDVLNTNRNQVKLLTINDLNKTCLNQKWDRIKIVCEQKFNRLNSFGLAFIKLYSVLVVNKLDNIIISNADNTSKKDTYCACY